MYSRENDNTVLTLSASGWTYNFTFVLYDYETESMWYHFEGEDGLRCISGKYADRKLVEFTSFFIQWNEWRFNYPESKYSKYP